MTIASALKKVITNLGGTPTKKTVEGLINEVADNVSGGDGSGGGTVFPMTAKIVNGQFTEFTIQANTEDVVSAFKKGPVTVVLSDEESIDMVFSLCTMWVNGGLYQFPVVLPILTPGAFAGEVGEKPVMQLG